MPIIRPDAQKSTESGVGVTVTFHTVPRVTTSPVFKLLDQSAPPVGGGLQPAVVTDSAAFGDRLPAASKESTAREYAVPHDKPLNDAVVAVVVATELPARYRP